MLGDACKSNTDVKPVWQGSWQALSIQRGLTLAKFIG
jgi:hypothetical protein